ncbi:MAG: DNA-protecting protein DprA [Planctomycetes bacterium]|nr:DNA-protecting protein DprA [Planctomycetota bacterium]
MELADLPLHIRPASQHWPEELRTIDAPPESLWLRGQVEVLAPAKRVALVGSRSPTPYGEAQARRFARALAENGVVVVSGYARGIDQAAHRAALEAGGRTIAVLGNGVARPWPECELLPRILAEGLFLSEHAPEEAPRPHHFPLRNRLISALSSAVLVIEAAHASGSLITARWAADQGREVFALPGRVDHPMARGCHRLLREGARLLEDPEEVLADLGLGSQAPEAISQAERAPDSLVLAELRGETLTADELSRRTHRPLTSVIVELVEAEMAGRVARTPGGLFRLRERSELSE